MLYEASGELRVKWETRVPARVRCAARDAEGGGFDLAVDGRDVMRVAEVPEGPEVGRVLRQLEEMVDDDPEKNERRVLLDALAKYKISGRLV